MSELAKRGEKWARRNGRSPYDVMDLKDICALPVGDLADKNCMLFMWTTFPKLDEAFVVLNSWEFKYKTVAFVWVKLYPKWMNIFYKALSSGGPELVLEKIFCFGLGFWTRANAEICLLATRGSCHRIDNCVSQLIFSPRADHSRKPDIVRDRIVQLVGDLPRIELFARSRCLGWDAWGNEVPDEIIGSAEPQFNNQIQTIQQSFFK